MLILGISGFSAIFQCRHIVSVNQIHLAFLSSFLLTHPPQAVVNHCSTFRLAFFFLTFTYERQNTWCLSLCVCPFSLNIKSTSSIHFAANGFSFFFVGEYHWIPLCMYTMFFYSSVNGHWGWLLILAIVKSVAIKIGMKRSLQHVILFPLDLCPEVG